MKGSRRFSQAIAEGDGISLLADADGADSARAAEAAGAEAIVFRSAEAAAPAATELPVLWCAKGSLERVRQAGADAVLLPIGAADDDRQLDTAPRDAGELGLEAVVEVRDEDELQLALDRIDPEILLLSAPSDEQDALEHVLSLLPDVPAGKLAIASVDVRGHEEIAELERAGFDGVVVPASRVAELLQAAPREG